MKIVTFSYKYNTKIMKKYLLFVIIPLVGLNSCNQKEVSKQPNVIFIITDDQKLESFGFIEGRALTPRIDRMANEGVYFPNAYVASSVCTPSRFTCLTGMYASRCYTDRFKSDYSEEGVPKIVWNLGLVQGQHLVSTVMKDAGYRTGFVGKWHVGGISDGRKNVPPGSNPEDPEINDVLKGNQEVYCKNLRERWGFDFAGSVYSGNPNDDRNLVNTGCNVHNMEWLTKAALEFIESSGDQPFYLYFSPTLLHVPFVEESLKDDPRKSGAGLLDEPITDVLPSRESVLKRVADAGIPETNAGATWLDDGIGVILDKLDELGIAENTLVIYFNDNGLEDHAKGTCYQGGIRIPVMALWKGKTEPAVREELISNIDFVPTIFDVCGVEAPEDMELDGESLMPLIMGDTPDAWRKSVYSEIGYTRTVVTKGWKYIAFKVPASETRTREERFAEHEPYFKEQLEIQPWMKEVYSLNPDAPYYQMGMMAGGHRFEWGQYRPDAPWYENYFDSDQLYDLVNDPKETTNLAGDPAMAGKLAEMKELLKKEMETLPGTFTEMLED